LKKSILLLRNAPEGAKRNGGTCCDNKVVEWDNGGNRGAY